MTRTRTAKQGQGPDGPAVNLRAAGYAQRVSRRPRRPGSGRGPDQPPRPAVARSEPGPGPGMPTASPGRDGGVSVTSVGRALEDVEVIEAQLEPAVLAPPPQRGGEDGVKVTRPEPVVLVRLDPGDQVQPHENVQQDVDRRGGHRDDKDPVRGQQLSQFLGPGRQLGLGHVLDDGQRGGRIERLFRRRRQVNGEEPLHQRYPGERGRRDQLRIDADPLAPVSRNIVPSCVPMSSSRETGGSSRSAIRTRHRCRSWSNQVIWGAGADPLRSGTDDARRVHGRPPEPSNHGVDIPRPPWSRSGPR